MFHRDNLRVTFEDDRDDDIDPINLNDNNDNNPVGSIVAAIHKQQVKKTAALPKNTIADPAGVIIYNYIKLAGVKADPMKKVITLLANKDKFEPKLLSDVSQFLSSNRIEAFALVYNASLDYLERNVKNDVNKSIKIKKLREVFKQIAFKVLQSIPQIKVSSMSKEFHAMICNADMNPYTANDTISQRFDILSQQLQHQIDDNYQFDTSFVCLVHNVMPPCKDTKCPSPHVCAVCGHKGHIITDPRCPKYHNNKEWFIKRLIEVNKYYNNKSKNQEINIFNNNRYNFDIQ